MVNRIDSVVNWSTGQWSTGQWYLVNRIDTPKWDDEDVVQRASMCSLPPRSVTLKNQMLKVTISCWLHKINCWKVFNKTWNYSRMWRVYYNQVAILMVKVTFKSHILWPILTFKLMIYKKQLLGQMITILGHNVQSKTTKSLPYTWRSYVNSIYFMFTP